MATDAKETATLTHAAALLSAAPWYWSVTVEYPGYLCIVFDRDEETERIYAAGFANPTLTVDQQNRAGASLHSYNTGVSCETLDGYRFAIQTAAAIDHLEQEGSAS